MPSAHRKNRCFIQPLRILVTAAFQKAAFVFAEARCFAIIGMGNSLDIPKSFSDLGVESGHFAVPFRRFTTSSIVDGKKA